MHLCQLCAVDICRNAKTEIRFKFYASKTSQFFVTAVGAFLSTE